MVLDHGITLLHITANTMKYKTHFLIYMFHVKIIHFSTVSILRPKHVKIVFVSYLIFCSGPTCTRCILPKLFLSTTSYREARLTYIQYACIYTNILILPYRNKILPYHRLTTKKLKFLFFA